MCLKRGLSTLWNHSTYMVGKFTGKPWVKTVSICIIQEVFKNFLQKCFTVMHIHSNQFSGSSDRKETEVTHSHMQTSG